MATIKYSDLLVDVLPNLAADPSDPVSENAIKRTVIDFCAATWIWKYLADPVSILANEAFYDIETQSGSDVAMVMSLTFNNEVLTNQTPDWLDKNSSGWRTRRETPRFYTQVDSEQVILAGVPDSNIPNGLVATVALQPSQKSVGFPGWIYVQYVDTLVSGALSRLMLMPNKPWTDLQNGADRRASFLMGIANTRASAVMALGRGSTRTTTQH